MSTTDDAARSGVRRPLQAKVGLRVSRRDGFQPSFAHFRVTRETVHVGIPGDDKIVGRPTVNLYCSALRECNSDVTHSNLENCIEKNFHVSNMRAVRIRVRPACGCNFESKIL